MAEVRLCSIPNCRKRHYARGWCHAHYEMNRKTGSPIVVPRARKMPPPCSIAGCESPGRQRGWCRMHYTRWIRHGDPLHSEAPERGAALRFFQETVLTFDGDECLPWPFGPYGDHYPIIQIEKGPKSAHRMVCEAAHGVPPSPEHEAAHSCGNKRCVNRWHIRWATPKENSGDKWLHGTVPHGERHHRAKLTKHAVRQIRALHPSVSRAELARRYGVAPKYIQSIVSRRAWAWLD